MANETYNLVFSGQLARGAEMVAAKRNIQALFKVSDAQLESLFSGNPVVLKKGLNFETATKYRVAIKKAGCLVDVQEQKAAAAPAPAPAARGRAVFGAQEPTQAAQTAPVKTPEPTTKPEPALDEPTPTKVATPVAAAKQSATGAFAYQDSIEAPALDIAPAGADLLNEFEKPKHEQREVDTAGLSVKPQGGDLIEDSERVHVEARQIDTSGLDVAPAGSDVLKPEERVQVKAVEVDISGISLAEVGSRLADEKEEIPLPEPDISGLALVENK